MSVSTKTASGKKRSCFLTYYRQNRGSCLGGIEGWLNTYTKTVNYDLLMLSKPKVHVFIGTGDVAIINQAALIAVPKFVEYFVHSVGLGACQSI